MMEVKELKMCTKIKKKIRNEDFHWYMRTFLKN